MARRNKRIRPRKEAASSEPLVNAFAAQHGNYGVATVVDLSNELGGGRQKTYSVLINRGGSAIERWIHEQDSKLFGRPQVEAVRHCQRLWGRIDHKSSSIVGNGIASTDGETEQDARNELNGYAARFPNKLWWVFENVVRHEMPAGVAGEQMANNSRTQVEAAKLATAFVASMVAMWRGL